MLSKGQYNIRLRAELAKYIDPQYLNLQEVKFAAKKFRNDGLPPEEAAWIISTPLIDYISRTKRSKALLDEYF